MTETFTEKARTLKMLPEELDDLRKIRKPLVDQLRELFTNKPELKFWETLEILVDAIGHNKIIGILLDGIDNRRDAVQVVGDYVGHYETLRIIGEAVGRRRVLEIITDDIGHDETLEIIADAVRRREAPTASTK